MTVTRRSRGGHVAVTRRLQVAELFAGLDSNNDGNLEYKELEKVLKKKAKEMPKAKPKPKGALGRGAARVRSQRLQQGIE